MANKSLLNKIASTHLQRMKDQQDAPPASMDSQPDPAKPGETGPDQGKPSVTIRITHDKDASPEIQQDHGQSSEKKAEMAKMHSKGKAKK